MKVDAPFIFCYNELFKYLHQFGSPTVLRFWELLADAILGDFRRLAETEGVTGMAQYWCRTLRAEGAMFDMDIGVEQDYESLLLFISDCPSRRKMKEASIEPYTDYCGHCQALYGAVVQNLGYDYQQWPTETGCEIRICKGLCSSETGDTPPVAETL